MSSRLKLIQEKGLINPPKWIGSNMCYEVIMGSVAYGVSDIYEELATNHGSHSIYRVNIGKFQVSARDHVINGKKSIEERSKQKITVIAAEDQNGNQVFQPDNQMVTQFLYVISDKRPEIV